MGKATITPELLARAANSPGVQKASRDRAARMLPRAQRIAAQAGAGELSKALRTETGVRPGTKSAGGFKRPFVRIIAERTEEQQAKDRRSRLTPTQILRRSRV